MQYAGPSPYEPRITAAEKRRREAARDQWFEEEKTRIAEQRRLFAANLGPARAELQKAMMARAWDLLDAGECEACDALLEFVPEAAAVALLDEYLREGA